MSATLTAPARSLLRGAPLPRPVVGGDEVLTDHETVFAKVATRPLDVEWMAANHAFARHLPTPEPLHPPVRLSDDRWMLSFRYHRTDPTASAHAQAPALLAKVWRTAPPPVAATVSWESCLPVIRADIDRVADASLRVMLEDLLGAARAAVRTRLAHAEEPRPVWTHGDARPGSVMATSAGGLLLNWADTRLAWPETDAATYLHALLADPAAGPRRHAPAFLDAMVRYRLDLGLLDALVRIRAVAAAAALLTDAGGAGAPLARLALDIDLAHRGVSTTSACGAA